MPWLLIALLFRIIVERVRAYNRVRRAAKPSSICAECFYAHVQWGMRAQLAISCTYGGVVRPMKLDVLHCTDYRARTLPFRNGAIGFVREIAPAEWPKRTSGAA